MAGGASRPPSLPMNYHEITLGGESLPIAFPVAALDRFGQRMGKDAFQALADVEGNSLAAICELLRCGLESGAKRAGCTLPEWVSTDFLERIEFSELPQVMEVLQNYLPKPGETKPTTATKG